MNESKIEKALTDAGVTFRKDWFMSNQFNGTRFTFSKRDIKKVEKALPESRIWIKAHFKEWCLEVF